MDFNGVIW